MSLLGLGPSRHCLRIASHAAVRPTCGLRVAARPFSTTPLFQKKSTAPKSLNAKGKKQPASKKLQNDRKPEPAPAAAGSAEKVGLLKRIKLFAADRSNHGGVVTFYDDLPKTYRDIDGLAFSKRDLTPEEVRDVFGGSLTSERAHKLLRIMHGRRVAGTLSDPVYTVNTAKYSPEQIQTALDYLRQKIPVDETLNAGLRAQDELEALEKQLRQETEKTETSAEGKEQDKVKEEVPYHPDPVYGHSQLDVMRARNAAREEAEAKRRAEQREKEGEVVAGTLEEYRQQRGVSPWVEKYQEKGQLSDLQEPPPMSLWERVGPSLVFTLLLVAGSIGFAMIYEPPEDENRIFWDMSASTATVGTLVFSNILVFALWRFPPAWYYLNKYFVSVVGMPRAFSMIGAVFSHQHFKHLLLNMSLLAFVGPRLHDDVGRANFLAIYLSAGAIGNCFGLLFHQLVVLSMGASGSIWGVVAAYFYLHRWDRFRLLDYPPPPAEGVHGIVFLGMAFLWHAIELFAPSRVVAIMSADVASHIMGFLSGMGMAAFLQSAAKTIPGSDEEGQLKSGHIEAATGKVTPKAVEEGTMLPTPDEKGVVGPPANVRRP